MIYQLLDEPPPSNPPPPQSLPDEFEESWSVEESCESHLVLLLECLAGMKITFVKSIPKNVNSLFLLPLL